MLLLDRSPLPTYPICLPFLTQMVILLLNSSQPFLISFQRLIQSLPHLITVLAPNQFPELSLDDLPPQALSLKGKPP